MTDILGMEAIYSKDEVLSPINATIQQLARSISDEILRLNGKAPKAVMLVGGGSQTPRLTNYVAECLGLPENRVAIRGAEAIKLLQTSTAEHYGPELVTPIGIAIAAKENPIEYISVGVNGRMLRLFDVKKLTVGDGLLAAGIDIAKLYGKPGLAIMTTVQEQLISVPGEHGGPPILLKNGQVTSLDAPLEPNDELIVERGKDGKQAEITIAELLGDIPTLSLTINEETIHIPATILQNGESAQPHSLVLERDQITVIHTRKVKDVFVLENIPLYIFKPFSVTVNEERWVFRQEASPIFVNGQPVDLEHTLKTGDVITFQATQINHEYRVAKLLQSKNVQTHVSLTIFYNNEPVTLEKSVIEVKRGQEILTLDDIVQPEDQLTLMNKKEDSFIFQDIFTAIDINLTELTGKKVSLKRNGQNTGFSSPLVSGDRIELLIGDTSLPTQS